MAQSFCRDKEDIILSLNKTGCIVSAEEHQKFGGLGSAIAEFLVESDFGKNIPMEFIAVNDSFGESGKAEEVLNKYGLSVNDIVAKAKHCVERKKFI